METPTKKIVQFKTEGDLKAILATQYMKQIENLFGDKEKALEFLSNVVASVQRVPKLMECTPESLLNSFVVMASLKLMPSGVSGEAFVLPYNIKGTMVAQFQLGYQGLVTLFYRAGARSIVAEIVHARDEFSNLNGEIKHVFDPFLDDRGDAIGAYVIVELQTGGKIYKAMSKKQILGIAQKFSKSYGGDFGPWSKGQDPELWMWKKTVLKQAAKLVPKNETIYKAIAADNEDSVISSKDEGMKGLAAPVVDVEEQVALIRSAKTIEGLKLVWADLPGDAKASASVKEAFADMEAILKAEEGEPVLEKTA